MKTIMPKQIFFALVSGLACLFTISPEAAAQKNKTEMIEAVARGTSTQLGRVVNVTIHIYEYSNDEDRAALMGAYQEKGERGLVNALDKMKSKGRIAITGTLGFDLSYIRSFPQADGSRIIRFVTDRPITFAEAWSSARTMDYQLSLGEVVIRKEKGKSTGTLVPVAELKLDKENHIMIEAYKNSWELVNIMMRK